MRDVAKTTGFKRPARALSSRYWLQVRKCRVMSQLSASAFMVWAVLGVFSPTTGNAESSNDGATLHLLQETRDLARHAGIIQAFEHMRARHEETIGQMITLNEIPAPPFGESERAAVFAELLADAGVENVSVDPIGNISGLRRGEPGGRTVAIIAHLDSVFPAETDVTVRQDGSIYSAPGIGDNARGLALMLTLADAIDTADLRLRDNLLFIGSVGEEGLGDLRGVRYLFGDALERQPIDSVIVIDGGDTTRIVTQAVGSNRYRVTFTGPGGHSYGQFGRAHPHQALAGAISAFTSAASEIVAAGGEKATFSVGRIGGGTSINSIPFESWMEVDMRSTDPARLSALDAALQQAIQRSLNAENARRRGGDALSVDIQSVGRRPAGSLAETLPLVQRAVAAQRQLGLEPILSASSTDANIPISLGIPAVTISRGGKSRNAHAPDESWEDIDTHTAEKFALLLIASEAGAETGSGD